jgi:modulator of FtsH protease HflK
MSILSVSLIDARPPSEVAAEFSSAQSAESQRDRRGHEARSCAETTLTAAKATAQAKLEHARGASQSKISSSRAQAERFLGLLTEARRARSLTVHRV